jgi:high-affinity iron transporter
VGAGLVASLLVGFAFGWVALALTDIDPRYATVVEPLLEGVFGVFAIAMLSWMLLWMTRQARFLKGQVEGSVAALLGHDGQAGWGLFALALFAVVREGFESVLFIFSRLQQGLAGALGAGLGVAAAAGIGVVLFRFGVRLNLGAFFKAMGVLLLAIVAGLVVTTLGHLDTAATAIARADRSAEAICVFGEHFVRNPSCILGPTVWNAAAVLPDDRFPGAVLSALFGYVHHLYLLQAVAYVLFVAVAGWLYARSLSGKPLNPFAPAAKPRSVGQPAE